MYVTTLKKEKAVKCPFNPEHVVFESVLQKHIIKCMVNYPHFLACPYNALHRLRNRKALIDHMLICPSKITRVSLFYDHENNTVEESEVGYHLENTREFNLAEENWDEELDRGQPV